MRIVRSILMLIVVLSLFSLVIGCQSKAPISNTPSVTQSTELSLTSTSLPRALLSGKPILAEFGRGTCIPCKAMKPILDNLAIEYRDKLNVVIVSVDDYRDLTISYEIMAIPTQIFLDSSGKEVARHIGFYPKEDIVAQLKEMGIE